MKKQLIPVRKDNTRSGYDDIALRFGGAPFSFCERNKAAGMAVQPDSFAGNLTGIGVVPNKQFSADGRRRKIPHTEAVAAVCPACQFANNLKMAILN